MRKSFCYSTFFFSPAWRTALAVFEQLRMMLHLGVFVKNRVVLKGVRALEISASKLFLVCDVYLSIIGRLERNALSQGRLWSAGLSGSCRLVMMKIFVMAEVLLKTVRKQVEIPDEKLPGIFIPYQDIREPLIKPSMSCIARKIMMIARSATKIVAILRCRGVRHSEHMIFS